MTRFLSHHLEMMLYQAIGQLKAETSRALLGFVWWILEPFLYLLIFFFVFGMVFKRGGEGFVPFLLCGLLVWKWFASCLMQGAIAITRNGRLINQVYLPKYIFPTVIILANTIKFSLVFALLLPALVISGYPVTTTWLALPLLVLVQLIVIFATTGVVAAVVPFVPDLKVIITNGIPLLLFMSGVIFKLSRVPADLQWLVKLNPLVFTIEGFRNVLLENAWPNWMGLGYATLFGLAGSLCAWHLLRRYDKIYPKFVE